jgi:hypothetical protein
MIDEVVETRRTHVERRDRREHDAAHLCRTARRSGRPSFRVTSAARQISVSPRQFATALAVLMLQGTMAIPTVLNDPLAGAAPMSRLL